MPKLMSCQFDLFDGQLFITSLLNITFTVISRALRWEMGHCSKQCNAQDCFHTVYARPLLDMLDAKCIDDAIFIDALFHRTIWKKS